MSEKRWVQHISGQGEKWPASEEGVIAWRVYTNAYQPDLWLPKSEYRLCDPPEVWKDVSGECEVPGDDRQCTITHKGTMFNTQDGYRFRKVQLETPHKCGKTLASIVWAFIVEQKVTQ